MTGDQPEEDVGRGADAAAAPLRRRLGHAGRHAPLLQTARGGGGHVKRVVPEHVLDCAANVATNACS